MIENNSNKDLERESKQAPKNQNQIINKSLKLETVNEGDNEDDVLVRGADKTVKFVPRSEFGGDSQDLQTVLTNGNKSDLGFVLESTPESDSLPKIITKTGGFPENNNESIIEPSAISVKFKGNGNVNNEQTTIYQNGVNLSYWVPEWESWQSVATLGTAVDLNNKKYSALILGKEGGAGAQLMQNPLETNSDTYYFPLSDIETEPKTLVTSVNGAKADANGNIEISNETSIPTFDQVLGTGFTATDKATHWRYSTEGGAGQIGVSAIGPMLIQTQDQTHAPELLATSSISPHEISIIDGMNNDFSNILRVNNLSFKNRAGADGTGHANTFSFNHAQDNSLTESVDTKVTLPQNNGEYFLPLTINGISADKTGNITVPSNSDCIPLSGTVSGNPLTGDIFMDTSTGGGAPLGLVAEKIYSETTRLKCGYNIQKDSQYMDIFWEENLLNGYSKYSFNFRKGTLALTGFKPEEGHRGIEGSVDYSPNYTDYTYVQKKWVLDQISAGNKNTGLEDTLKNNGEAFLEDGTCQTDIIFTAENDTSTVVLSGAKGSDVTTLSIDNGIFSLRNKQAGFGHNTLKFDTAHSSSNVNILIPSKNSAGDYKLATEDQINLQQIVENGTKYTDQYGNKIEFLEGFAGYNSTLSFYPTTVMISGIKNGKSFGASLNSDYVGASYDDKQIRLIPSEAAIYIQASYSASAKIRTNALTADRNYQLPDKNGTIALTSDIATSNPNTVPLSLSYLNTSYPSAGIGFRVHCTGISGGGLIYEKSDNGWVQYSVTKVN
ncbi:hypothetical protein [Flavobacterium humidisoli]|uniref:Uncharacterized protein n=1 Tax=Flavobacterium humidisoli TaxID=2937442 RepID=A0ABY4LZA4_9FLAO|nr:hypothetical protein [Flavobacterium humidisoli]UPZ17758.1 hypothetical protein M0M44_10510 [Flavobacterium humidisoli]